MAVTHRPVFAQTPNIAVGICTAADTAPEGVGTTNRVSIFTAGSNGSEITRISCTPRATNTALVLMIFRQAGGSGDVQLVKQMLIAADTVSTTDAGEETAFTWPTEDSPMRLEAGDVLYGSISVAVANGISVFIQGADL